MLFICCDLYWDFVSDVLDWLLSYLLVAELQIEPNQNHLLTNLKGSIFAWLFVRLVVVCHGDVTVVTVAFEDAQVIQTLMDVECWMMDD